jgi:hypothetical protein
MSYLRRSQHKCAVPGIKAVILRSNATKNLKQCTG